MQANEWAGQKVQYRSILDKVLHPGATSTGTVHYVLDFDSAGAPRTLLVIKDRGFGTPSKIPVSDIVAVL